MTDVASWGRLERHAHNVVALTDAAGVPATVAHTSRPGLAFGMGRSYGDVCLNPGGSLWDTHHMARFVSFDEDTGVLACEAGTLLGDIQRTFAPRGWMLPVSPGTQFVTVGGAIANDVHGKNHHLRGTFGDHVGALTLARTDGQVIECGPADNREWFAATVAGLGLTGVITQASLQLARVPGPWLETEAIPFHGVDEFFSLADTSEAGWEYTVAWIDCLSRRERGIFFRGRPMAADAPEPRAPARSVPVELPVPLINRFTLRMFNSAYYAAQVAGPRRRREHYAQFLYPLDHVAHWNRIYGPRGFYQYQCVVPHGARAPAIREMMDMIRRSGEGSFLAVLKTFGNRPPAGMLSFPLHGATLALDFPNTGDGTLRLLERLDTILRGCGGRIYPAKDARMPADLFQAGFPNWREMRRFRDPGISSAMSRRLMGD